MDIYITFVQSEQSCSLSAPAVVRPPEPLCFNIMEV